MKDISSDEIHLQAAMRHHEDAAFLPWQAMAPDEELMAKEEPEERQYVDAGLKWEAMSPDEEMMRNEEDLQGYSRRAMRNGLETKQGRWWLQEEVMAYLFGDAEPERWENVAMRALAVFWHCLPGMLVGRDMSELDRVKKTAVIRRGFNLEEFVRLSADEEWQDMLKVLMNFLFPAKAGWMNKGAQRAYLLARAYQPELVMIKKKRDGKEVRVDLNYEDMARIFENETLATEEERDRARARWSARAQVLLRHPVEQAGGVAHIRFGKSATARKGMAESAKRTCNRRKG